MKSHDVSFWKEAIDDEMDSILENNTWVLSDLPRGCKPLGCKWIFKKKMKVDGTLDKYKTRLVIQRFSIDSKLIMVPTNWETKLSEWRKKAFGVDRISNLPDSILSYILSFLSIKQVVATSILSKPWRNVWTNVDKIYFDDCNGEKQRCGFAPFVYRILLPLLVELKNSKTLVDLQIYELVDITNMYISSVSFFPCQRKLYIQHVRCDTKSLKYFISRCLVLERFSSNLSDLWNEEVIAVDIVSSTLKRIELLSSRNGFEQKFHLDVPALEFLLFRSTLLPEITIQEQLSFLVEADITSLTTCPSEITNINQLRESFERFIQNFANVKVLRLHFHLPKFFTSVGHAQFHNLTKLEIHSTYFEWRLLARLMDSSINLEDITLKKTSILKKHKLAWKEPKDVPTCLSTSLRKISLVGYSEDELPMVKYVLRTAEILERLDIQCSTFYRDENELKSVMLQKIQKLHRASQRCEVSLGQVCPVDNLVQQFRDKILQI